MTPAHDDEPPGLQPERTLLAWTRTLLAVVVTASLLVRLLGAPITRPAHVPAAVVVALAVWLFVASDRRYRRAEDRVRVVPALHLLLLAAAVVAVGVVAVVALLAR